MRNNHVAACIDGDVGSIMDQVSIPPRLSDDVEVIDEGKLRRTVANRGGGRLLSSGALIRVPGYESDPGYAPWHKLFFRRRDLVVRLICVSSPQVRSPRPGGRLLQAGHDIEVVEDPPIGIDVGLAVGREQDGTDVQDARRVGRSERADRFAAACR